MPYSASQAELATPQRFALPSIDYRVCAQRVRECFEVELRLTTRAREGANIYQKVYAGRLEQAD